MDTRRLLLIFFTAFLILVGYVYFFMYNKPHQDVHEARPDFTIEAMALYNEFEDDEVVANERYLGKIIRLEGRVLEVEVRDGKPSAIRLDVGHVLNSVVCELDEVYPRAIQGLEMGDKVVVQGVCTGYLDDVILNRCGLIRRVDDSK